MADLRGTISLQITREHNEHQPQLTLNISTPRDKGIPSRNFAMGIFKIQRAVNWDAKPLYWTYVNKRRREKDES